MERYYSRLAAAYLRGLALNALSNGGFLDGFESERNGRAFSLPTELVESSLDLLSDAEMEKILEIGKNADVKLYRFKNTREDLPRVKRILGFLRSTGFESLLDVGSGCGAFLWACLNDFPTAQITALDLLPQWGKLYSLVRAGGIDNLDGRVADVAQVDFPVRSFDVVSLLEVLEHIPDYKAAIRAAVRLSRHYVVFSVPSKPDDNPARIHFFSQEILKNAFADAGVVRLKYNDVDDSIVGFATLDETNGQKL